jgi:hypothetical protein
MASPITYTLLPEPIWYYVDLSGLPLGAGLMFTYSSLNPTVPKPVFQDAAGANAWPNPVLINLNGTQGPFYWQFDPSNPDDLYDIVVRDDMGNLIWQVDNFSGGSGGGGGTVTVVQSLTNYLVNGVFWRNIGSIALGNVQTNNIIAPGAHDGFVNGANVGGPTGPDIIFAKNSLVNSDSLTFMNFTPGSNALSPDVTPVQYLNYTCSGSGAGEVYKYVQFPIDSNSQNLSNTAVTVTVWARCNGGSNQVVLYWRQFYGDSGGAPDTRTPFATLTLTSAWAPYVIPTTTPNPAGQAIGACGNSGLFLQFEYPLTAVTNIDFVKPCVFLGTLSPPATFDTYDQIDAVIDTPRTGDIRTSVNNFQPFGWLQMNDGTIGSATSNATTRSNIDTFPLFSMIWNGVSNIDAPIYTSAGVPTTRGASAVADFAANTQLSLTKALGRVFAGTVTPRVFTSYTTNFSVNSQLTLASTAAYPTGAPVYISTGTPPAPLAINTLYYVINLTPTTLELATTPQNAFASIPITLTSNASGSQIAISYYALGDYLGEINHTQTTAELAAHVHTGHFVYPQINSASGGTPAVGQPGGSSTFDFTTDSTGSSTPFNVMQPTTFMNVFIHL